MPKDEEEIRKSISKYEESLSDAERNPGVQKDVENLIERAAQPLVVKRGKPRRSGGYTDTQTHSHNTEDTSDSHSDTSHLPTASTDSKNPQ